MSKSLQERLNSLERKYKGLCCKITNTVPEVQGCVTFTDITWEDFIAAIDNGSIADCYYNITNRPNSGENPLYVLVEKGLPNFDNEVKRGEQALASFCIGDETTGNGCFNVYASSTYTFDLTPWETCAIRISCREELLSIEVGTVLHLTNADQSYSTTVTVIGIEDKAGWFFIDTCLPEVEKLSVGLDGINYPCNLADIKKSPIYSGSTAICRRIKFEVGTLICSDSGQAVITELTETSISFEPISGSWEGISVFWVCDQPIIGCYTFIIPPIVITSALLNSEPICFSRSILGFDAYSNQMLLASDGNLYGVLATGPLKGQLITVDPSTDVVTILVEKLPSLYCSLVEVSGILYGIDNDGGDNDVGSIWSYEISSQLFTTLYSLSYSEGAYSYSGLCNVGGILYGNCENGGIDNYGTLFSWNIATSTFSLIANLSDFDIHYPQGTLVEVAPNKLWGTSYRGGSYFNGTVYEYNITTGTISIILDLDGGINGAEGSGGVFKASNGNVYLQTSSKGPTDFGTIIKIENVGTTNDSSVIFSYNDSTGYSPDAVAPVEIGGILYGVAPFGGVNVGVGDFGTIWSLDLVSEDFNVLYTFQTGSGFAPFTSLCVVGTNLYGMTQEWDKKKGEYRGSIYKFNTLSNTHTVVTPLNTIIGDPNQIALITCSALDNPAYTCTVIDGCVYVTGSAYGEDNGQILEVRTLYTLEYSPDGDDPVAGEQLYIDGALVGTIIDVDTVSGTMRIEWTNTHPPGDYSYPVSYEEASSGNTGTILDYFGQQVIYTSTPFTGGDPFPHNMPCYYNSKVDIIVDYPMSQAFTKAEIQKFIEDKTLVPGAFYFIKGLDVTLYGGTTCILQADTPNKFKMRGSGLFHTPGNRATIYNRTAPYYEGNTVLWGGQIWTCILTTNLGLGLVVDAFDNYFSLNPTYFTNGATSCVVFVNPGSLDPGSTPGATFNIGDEVDFLLGHPTNAIITDVYIDNSDYNISYLVLNLPSLDNFNSTLITNLTTGATINVVTEVGESTWNIADYTAYNEQWDEITYDQDNDFITSRKDVVSNYVEQSFTNYNDYNDFEYRSIKTFLWGQNAYQSDGDLYGVGSNTIINSVARIINLPDIELFYDNTLTHTSTLDCSFYAFHNSTLIDSGVFNASCDYFFRVSLEGSYLTNFTGNLNSFTSLNSYIDFDSSVFSTTVMNIKFNNIGYFATNIDTASTIYNAGISKEVYTNESGTPKMFYLNGSGSISLVNVSA